MLAGEYKIAEMILMDISINLDYAKIMQIEQAAKDSAVKALEAVRTDLISSSGTMPYDTGDMQNNQTFVESTETGAVLVTGSPQARRLYYHPEYNFQRNKNKNAGAGWLEPYLTGDKKDFVKDKFIDILNKKLN